MTQELYPDLNPRDIPNELSDRRQINGDNAPYDIPSDHYYDPEIAFPNNADGVDAKVIPISRATSYVVPEYSTEDPAKNRL